MSTLFYVVGPSGSGKDSLLDYARARLDGAVLFAHRYITRPAKAGGENHISLTEAEFERRARAGLFALHWQSHGYRYGLGVEVDLWLRYGQSVVVNGSREHYREAGERYANLQLVWISVDTATLRQRLERRGRESEAAIRQRLWRAAQYPPPALADAVVINNDGPLSSAGERLVEVLAGENVPIRRH